jgi:hypothetical protein
VWWWVKGVKVYTRVTWYILGKQRAATFPKQSNELRIMIVWFTTGKSHTYSGKELIGFGSKVNEEKSQEINLLLSLLTNFLLVPSGFVWKK